MDRGVPGRPSFFCVVLGTALGYRHRCCRPPSTTISSALTAVGCTPVAVGRPPMGKLDVMDGSGFSVCCQGPHLGHLLRVHRAHMTRSHGLRSGQRWAASQGLQPLGAL